MAVDFNRLYRKTLTAFLGIMFLIFGVTIFGLNINSYMAPLTLVMASLVLGYHIYVVRSVDTVKEVGVPELAFIIVAIITGVAGVLGFWMINNTALSTMAGVGLLFAAMVMIADAFAK